MKKAVAVTLVLLAVWSIIIFVGRGKKAGTEYGPDIDGEAVERPGDRSFRKAALREVEVAIADWPERSRAVAHRMIEKYGVPDDVGRRSLVWNDNGPWKRTIVRRGGGNDVLEQVAAYRVRNDAYELIRGLPGSVSAERGRDELASRAESEPANFLALNLADEVLSGKRRTESARAAYDHELQLVSSGKASAYTQGLLFVETPAAPQAPAVPASRARTGGRK